MEDIHKLLLDSLHDGVYFVDRKRRITSWNHGAETLTGFPGEEVIGKPCSDNVLNHVDGEGRALCRDACPLAATMLDGLHREVEVFLHHKDGHRIPVRVRAFPVRDGEGEIIGAVESFGDNSAKAAVEQRVRELEELALLDPLTRLGNRRYIEMNIQSSLYELQRYSWPFGVLFMDIDRFKAVNDAHGHETGDEVLRMVSGTLASNMRSFDFLGRWGGDEFVAVVVNIHQDGLMAIAGRLRSLVRASFLSRAEGTLGVTVSIGAATALPDDNVDSLIDRVDRRMYTSKAAGGNRVTGPSEAKRPDP
jgi:diguanylate cyclase (GGDEF)-like protein/PAS domain S-box-containing protein